MADLANAQAGSLPYGAQRRLSRACTGHRPEAAAAGRACRRYEPLRDGRTDRDHPPHRDGFNIAVLLMGHDMSLVMGICEALRC